MARFVRSLCRTVSGIHDAVQPLALYVTMNPGHVAPLPNTQATYSYAPRIVPPGGTLHVKARLDLPPHWEGIQEKPIQDTFWVEVETDNQKKAILVAKLSGKQINCLLNAPNYLHIKCDHKNILFFNFCNSIDLNDIRILSNIPGIILSIDRKSRALKIKVIKYKTFRYGKIIVKLKDSIIKTINVNIEPCSPVQTLPSSLGLGIISKEKRVIRYLKIIFDSNYIADQYTKVQLVNPHTMAGQFLVRSIDRQQNTLILGVEFIPAPKATGKFQGRLILKAGRTEITVPWSCEIVR